jgi:hypothetical protein
LLKNDRVWKALEFFIMPEPAELPVPEVVTIRWLVNRVPWQLWSILGTILISCFTVGLEIGKTNRPDPLPAAELLHRVDTQESGHNLRALELTKAITALENAYTDCLARSTRPRDAFYDPCGAYYEQAEERKKELQQEMDSFNESVNALNSLRYGRRGER